VDTPERVDFAREVDMQWDADHDAEEDEVKEDEEEEEEEEEEEDEEEDEDECDDKEPQTIGQGEIVNTSGDHIGTMVNIKPIVLPAQGQDICKHSPHPQHLAHAQRPQTAEPRPRP
jgi:uncharacterized membrane protein YdbT with pleckstrin-like domain